MAYIEVYNPKPFPVVYGNGRTIGGLEWATVEQELVQEFIDSKRLILPKTSGDKVSNQPVVEISEESSIEDSSEPETDVSSDPVSQNEVVDDSPQDAPSDAPVVEEKPATIRKSRRRKRTTTERE